MCGRYLLYSLPEALQAAFDVDVRLNMEPRYNIAPTQRVPIVGLKEGKRRLGLAHWGLIPSWAKDRSVASKMINARSETAAEKPSFRSAFKARRCLIPADGFYEWHTEDGVKQPYLLEPAAGGPMAFAGLWEAWRAPEAEKDSAPLVSFTILTTQASPDVAQLHHRMPVILRPDDYDRWLNGPAEADGAILKGSPEEIGRAHV